jgi:hypothetical protein
MNVDMFAIQAFAACPFPILMLMALGLAIVFGLRRHQYRPRRADGHGRLLQLRHGAAVRALLSGHMDLYLFAGIALAFVVTSLFGFCSSAG